MKYRSLALAVVLLALPAAAFAQYGNAYGGKGYGAPRSPSVIRQAGMWENYAYVPDGHCGCPMPVRCNDYAHCCNTCGIRPVCWLKRFGRMLDCLLPCDCCHGGLLGCGSGCCGGGCGTCGSPWYAGGDYVGGDHVVGRAPGCASCAAGPALSDPFQDDPEPPVPQPEPAAPKDVRHQPKRVLPGPIARDPRPSSQARAALPRKSPTAVLEAAASTEGEPRPFSARAAALGKPADKSVLRRASAEESVEPATLVVEAKALPIEQAAPIVPSDDYWAGVPDNPLR
jgi:hypothetical protein